MSACVGSGVHVMPLTFNTLKHTSLYICPSGCVPLGVPTSFIGRSKMRRDSSEKRTRDFNKFKGLPHPPPPPPHVVPRTLLRQQTNARSGYMLCPLHSNTIASTLPIWVGSVGCAHIFHWKHSSGKRTVTASPPARCCSLLQQTNARS